jgi:hypothetical protein
MYRALQRGASRRILEHDKLRSVERRRQPAAASRETLLQTRAQVEQGWIAAAEILDRQGHEDLAWYVRRFTESLPPVRTDQELLRQGLRLREGRRSQQQELAP